MTKERLVAIGLVFLVGIPLVVLAALTIFSSYLERFIAAHVNVTMSWFWSLAGRGFILAAAMGMIAIIYHVGPHRRQSWRGVLPGAALATGLWFLATLAFSAYVSHFGEYNVIYGSLGAGIVLLIWMYLSSLAVLIGGEFNAVLETASCPAV
jgi:membrane protein